MARKTREHDHSKYRDWIDPNEVIPYERNAKKHDEKQIRNIANSIKRFGWQQDTVLTTDNVLVIGHGRRLAALKLGCEMPFHRIDKAADEVTDEDIRELRIADNQTNAETGFDMDLLTEDIGDLDFAGFEFDFDALSGGGIPVSDIPDNLDGEDYDGNGPLAVKLTFANYTAYIMHEDEIKEIAGQMGAQFSVVKA